MCLAIPGKIVSIAGADDLRAARVSFGGIVKEVNLAYVPEADIGDYVLVHVGFAITVIDEAEAAQTFEYLRQMDELGELAELSPDAPAAELQSHPADAAPDASVSSAKGGRS
jgi:hydrogenase expression/formation protein HypC